MDLKCHTQNPEIAPNNLNKGKHQSNVSVYYKTCNIDRKASISSFKVCYHLHPNLPILLQSVTKIIETHCKKVIKKVHKKTLELHKVTQNPPSHWLNVVPSLKKPRKVVKTRNEQPICNQHWMRGEGVRVSQFLSLIVDRCFYCFYWTYIFTEGVIKSSVLKKTFSRNLLKI